MGSTGCMNVDKGYKAANEFLIREVSQDGSTGTSFQVLKSQFVGSTWYAAVKIQRLPEEPYVVAFVFTTYRHRNGEFIYKDMEESCGPCQVDCPASIMKLLTPIEELERRGVHTSYAAHWRARVAEAAKNRAAKRKSRAELVDGQIVRFSRPVYFNKGKTIVTTATVHHVERRSRRWDSRLRRVLAFIAHENEDLLIRVPADALDGATIVTDDIEPDHAPPAPVYDPMAYLRAKADGLSKATGV